jgi:hypothetical protein
VTPVSPHGEGYRIGELERRMTRLEDEGLAKVLVRVEQTLIDANRRLESLEVTARALAESDARRTGSVGSLKGIPTVLMVLIAAIGAIIAVATLVSGP